MKNHNPLARMAKISGLFALLLLLFVSISFQRLQMAQADTANTAVSLSSNAVTNQSAGPAALVYGVLALGLLLAMVWLRRRYRVV